MEKRPKLEYAGQSSEEILAHVETHADYSLLFALQWGIQAKARALGGEDRLSEEERLVLAVLALEGEVNNGGYKQFFWNSSRRFAPTIVAALQRIDCERTAVLTERAIAALGLSAVIVEAVTAEIEQKNEERDQLLDACDTEFYTFNETTEKLLRFVVAERARIQVPRTEDYPRMPKKVPQTAKDSLFSMLQLRALVSKGRWQPSLEEAKAAARELATSKGITATDAEIEAAATLLAFKVAINRGDMELAGQLAVSAREMMGENGFHIIEQRRWVEAVLAAGRTEDADVASVRYLQWLGRLEGQRAAKKARFWAEMVRDHRRVLPESVRFLTEHFPEVDLDRLPEPRVILPAKEMYATMKPPRLEPKDDAN